MGERSYAATVSLLALLMSYLYDLRSLVNVVSQVVLSGQSRSRFSLFSLSMATINGKKLNN